MPELVSGANRVAVCLPRDWLACLSHGLQLSSIQNCREYSFPGAAEHPGLRPSHFTEHFPPSLLHAVGILHLPGDSLAAACSMPPGMRKSPLTIRKL